MLLVSIFFSLGNIEFNIDIKQQNTCINYSVPLKEQVTLVYIWYISKVNKYSICIKSKQKYKKVLKLRSTDAICSPLLSTHHFCSLTPLSYTPAITKVRHSRQGPATRCNEKDHFAAILRVLGASQPIAAHPRSLLKNRSSVASQLGAINYFYFLLRFSSQRSHIELFK